MMVAPPAKEPAAEVSAAAAAAADAAPAAAAAPETDSQLAAHMQQANIGGKKKAEKVIKLTEEQRAALDRAVAGLIEVNGQELTVRIPLSLAPFFLLFFLLFHNEKKRNQRKKKREMVVGRNVSARFELLTNPAWRAGATS